MFFSFDYSFTYVKLGMNKTNFTKFLIIIILIMNFKYLILIWLPVFLSEFNYIKFLNLNSLIKIWFNGSKGFQNKPNLISTYSFFTIGSISLKDNFDKVHDGTAPYVIDTTYRNNVEGVHKIAYLLRKDFIYDIEKNIYTYPYNISIDPMLYGGGPFFSMDELYAGKLKYLSTTCTKYLNIFVNKYRIDEDLYKTLKDIKKEPLMSESFFRAIQNNMPTFNLTNIIKNHFLITDHIKNLFGFYIYALHSIIDRPEEYNIAKGFDLHYRNFSSEEKVIAVVDVSKSNIGFGKSLSSFKELLYNKPLVNSPTIFAVHQIDKYISFFVYKPGFHSENNMLRKIFCYRDLMGLYVTDYGVKVIPQSNTIHPQVIFYNLTNEQDQMCIHIILKYIASCTNVPDIIIEDNQLKLNNSDQNYTMTPLTKNPLDPWGIDKNGNINQKGLLERDVGTQYLNESARMLKLMGKNPVTNDYNILNTTIGESSNTFNSVSSSSQNLLNIVNNSESTGFNPNITTPNPNVSIENFYISKSNIEWFLGQKTYEIETLYLLPRELTFKFTKFDKYEDYLEKLNDPQYRRSHIKALQSRIQKVIDRHGSIDAALFDINQNIKHGDINYILHDTFKTGYRKFTKETRLNQ
jgi:hypothetical protein